MFEIHGWNRSHFVRWSEASWVDFTAQSRGIIVRATWRAYDLHLFSTQHWGIVVRRHKGDDVNFGLTFRHIYWRCRSLSIIHRHFTTFSCIFNRNFSHDSASSFVMINKMLSTIWTTQVPNCKEIYAQASSSSMKTCAKKRKCRMKIGKQNSVPKVVMPSFRQTFSK